MVKVKNAEEFPIHFNELLDEWSKGIGDIQAVTKIFEELLKRFEWDRILLVLSNNAFRIYKVQTNRREKKKWLDRCHILHEAMETAKAKRLQEQLLKDAK